MFAEDVPQFYYFSLTIIACNLLKGSSFITTELQAHGEFCRKFMGFPKSSYP